MSPVSAVVRRWTIDDDPSLWVNFLVWVSILNIVALEWSNNYKEKENRNSMKILKKFELHFLVDKTSSELCWFPRRDLFRTKSDRRAEEYKQQSISICNSELLERCWNFLFPRQCSPELSKAQLLQPVWNLCTNLFFQMFLQLWPRFLSVPWQLVELFLRLFDSNGTNVKRPIERQCFLQFSLDFRFPELKFE